MFVQKLKLDSDRVGVVNEFTVRFRRFTSLVSLPGESSLVITFCVRHSLGEKSPYFKGLRENGQMM